MGEAAGESPTPHQAAWQTRAAWLTWVTMAIAVGAILLQDHRIGRERSVVPNYRAAADNWMTGQPLYNMAGSGFIYAPPSALVFVPWAMLPRPIGEIAWSGSILAVLAAGVFRLTRLVSDDPRWFLTATVATLAMSAGCARNGQATLMITGLMLLAAVDIGQQRWWRATLLLALALAFKPVAIVLVLLAAAIYPQMLWRLLIASAVVAVTPFLTQNPDYAASQYLAFVENSRVAFRHGETGYWAQLFGMLKVAGLDVPMPAQQATRLVFAAATLAATWLAARKLPGDRGVFYLVSFSNCYLMLFNSRTEGSTYAMVGPVYGILLAESWLRRRTSTGAAGFLLAIIATAFNYDLVKPITPPPREVWLAPLVCAVVSTVLVMRLRRELQRAGSRGSEEGQTREACAESPFSRAA